MTSPEPQQRTSQLKSPSPPPQISPSPAPKSPLLSRVLEFSSSRSGGAALTDDAIWKLLRDAGFDEDSIRRRDKATLIAYITKLESEIYDYQHHLGLLLLERKEWMAKYEQAKISADSAEANYKCDQAAHAFALAEARKREENLKKALGVEKLCIANIEKTLHELRAESAETKLASDAKLVEAHSMIEEAESHFSQADAKVHAAEALQAEASRYRGIAERNLQEVKAREDALRRQMEAFKSECDVKEKEICRERQCLFDHQKTLRQGQERLLEGQGLLNQREEDILERSLKLNQLEKESEALKVEVNNNQKVLDEERSHFELKIVSLSTREKALDERELLLDKKEQELLILQEKISSKEHDEIKRLKAEHEAALEMRRIEFEAELELKRRLAEGEIDSKRRACDCKEAELLQQEEELQKRIHDLESTSSALVGKENGIIQGMKCLDDKEQCLKVMENAIEAEKISLQREKEEIASEKLDLQKYKNLLEDERRKLVQAQEKLEVTQSERNDLLVLQTKLKEEIDCIRSEKLKLMAENDDLKAEKENFEIEWQLIDEKREELRKEAEWVAEERKAVSKFHKDVFESLKLEKDALREQFNQSVESLACEREAFMRKMEHEHAEWFHKIQKERAEFLRAIDLQKRELENCASRRQEEIDRLLREKEEAFEQEKAKELQNIDFQKELIAKELQIVAAEMKILEKERNKIALDREERGKEWPEIKNFIEELQILREKLQKQRELLHTEREDIQVRIQHLKDLVDIKVASENVVSDLQTSAAKSRKDEFRHCNLVSARTIINDAKQERRVLKDVNEGRSRLGVSSKLASYHDSPVVSSPLSWVKKCAELIFKSSPEKVDNNDINVEPNQLYGSRGTSAKNERPKSRRMDRHIDEVGGGKQPVVAVLEKSKVIFEVPLISSSVNCGSDFNNETNTCKMGAAKLKGTPTQNQCGERSVSIDGGKREASAGRKRRKIFSSLDAAVASSQKLKKTRIQGDLSEGFEEENPINCKVSADKESSEVKKCIRSLSQTDKEDHGSSDNHEILEDHDKIEDAQTSSKEIKCLENCSADICDERVAVGSNGHDSFRLVENGGLVPGSRPQRRPQTHIKALKRDFSELNEPVKEFNESLCEVIAESSLGPDHDSGSKQDISDEEGDHENADNSTIKQKVWNFLIT